MTVLRADGDRIAQAQRVELHRVRATPIVVSLVGDQDDRLLSPAQHVGHFLVADCKTCFGIHQEDHHLGFSDGNLRLVSHLVQEQPALHPRCLTDGRWLPALYGLSFVNPHLQTTRINHHKIHAAPIGLGVQPIAGGARQIFDDGHASPHYAIEQRALAYVRPSHQGHDRLPHRQTSTGKRVG